MWFVAPNLSLYIHMCCRLSALSKPTECKRINVQEFPMSTYHSDELWQSKWAASKYLVGVWHTYNPPLWIFWSLFIGNLSKKSLLKCLFTNWYNPYPSDAFMVIPLHQFAFHWNRTTKICLHSSVSSGQIPSSTDKFLHWFPSPYPLKTTTSSVP